MPLFSNAGIETTEERDSLGFSAAASDLYAGVIKLAYLDQYASGAYFMNLVVKLNSGNEVTERFTLSNRNGENFYTKEGKKHFLPDYERMNNAMLLFTGEALDVATNNSTETRKVKVWDNNKKEDVVADRKVYMKLINKKIHVGVLEVIENKQVPTEVSGKKVYIDDPTGATRTSNTFHKFFTEDKKTAAEVKADSEAKWYKKWIEKYAGKPVDKSKPVASAIKTGSSADEVVDDLFTES